MIATGPVVISNLLGDHSRLMVRSLDRVLPGCSVCGLPAAMLSDNVRAFPASSESSSSTGSAGPACDHDRPPAPPADNGQGRTALTEEVVAPSPAREEVAELKTQIPGSCSCERPHQGIAWLTSISRWRGDTGDVSSERTTRPGLTLTHAGSTRGLRPKNDPNSPPCLHLGAEWTGKNAVLLEEYARASRDGAR